MVREQQIKYMSGAKSNESVETMLVDLKKDMALNFSIEKGYTEGYPNMEKQFKMDYCIVFHSFDDTKWLIKSASSVRSDRIYGHEFFAQNIRIIDEHTKKIEKIFVVVPDSITSKETNEAKRYSDKINSETYKSFLSDIITMSRLRDLIIEKCMAEVSQGVRSNIIGKDAELRAVQLLEDKKNWLLWNDFESHKHEAKSDTFPWFRAIMTGIGAQPGVDGNISSDPIDSIEANDDIPKLDGGGFPKTDVSFTVSFHNRDKQTYNITIKKTSRGRVTVHEGDVDDLITALRLNSDYKLSSALHAFQKYGSEKHLRESNEAYHVDTLYSELPKHNRELVEFALFGLHSWRINHPSQLANCVLFKIDPNMDCFWLRDEYVSYYLNAFQTKGQFNTPFQWTYPSKKRGSSFQLKGFTNI